MLVTGYMAHSNSGFSKYVMPYNSFLCTAVIIGNKV